ncbi:hypothetical protein [Chromobacterium violaceum]|uniref:DUF342 domain-containing protein n=1 Tax=Chromobacterium violaceum (strain ATCC 12472 / DSM 30191 / JCM 1249 / CCUG 213 / NBRC 12614 / NCIMB 9131 / NCTC 9757 / MK) TaxID=243365 RepID=Q7NQQ5_CHRVO|nr:hypothetical protein [Chromobacterium violaceum]AAQ61742.1 hypothetical protein CV_4082 [Chromobacterium violaceum ATCC 12472]SUX89184.1 Uncharacterised protein [Chromobacterium violaceum]
MKRRSAGLTTLFAVLTLLAIASLVLLAASRQLVLIHANAQNQHRYHQALDYAEEGLRQGSLALAQGRPLPADNPRFALKQQTIPPNRVRLRSTGRYDGHLVTVQRDFLQTDNGGGSNQALTLVGNLDLSGAINLIGDKPVEMTVDGTVTLSGTVDGIAALQSTGDIIVTGSQTIGTLYANGNIELSNGRYQTVKALGNLTLRGDAAISELARVNGKAAFLSSPGVSPAVAQAEVKGDVDIAMGGARFGKLDTEGRVDIRQVGSLDALRAEGDLNVQGWGAPLAATVAGRASYNAGNPDIRIAFQPGLKLNLQPVPRLELKRPRLDAYDYRGQAHYVFTHAADGGVRVTVRKIHGLADGEYRLGRDPDKQLPNYLCRATDANGVCRAPATLICKGHSPQNDCFAGSRPGQWKLDGVTFAPGVLWFDGDLEVGNGTYHNTFIASGGIATSGQHVSYAVNYAGAVGVCANADFPNLYPDDDCQGGAFKGRPVGNAVLLAGGYVNGRFRGGDITLGSSSRVFGNVWAGNQLFSSGSTTIHGYVSALAQAGAQGSRPHQWSASTTIDLRGLPDSFRPDEPPDGGGQGGGGRLKALPYSWMDT